MSAQKKINRLLKEIAEIEAEVDELKTAGMDKQRRNWLDSALKRRAAELKLQMESKQRLVRIEEKVLEAERIGSVRIKTLAKRTRIRAIEASIDVEASIQKSTNQFNKHIELAETKTKREEKAQVQTQIQDTLAEIAQENPELHKILLTMQEHQCTLSEAKVILAKEEKTTDLLQDWIQKDIEQKKQINHNSSVFQSADSSNSSISTVECSKSLNIPDEAFSEALESSTNTSSRPILNIESDEN